MTNEPEPVGRVLRLVIDAVNECNLRCLYCHPGEVWKRQQLPLPALRSSLEASEAAGVLEVVLTGGEISLHHELAALLEATHLLRRTASTLITNATRITPELVAAMRSSNLTRICTSVDGVTNDLHGSARGKNLPKVLDGLRALNDTGKPVTVITVVHRRNRERVIELSEFLAGAGLASQHHLCAPSFSGQARAHYPNLALAEHEFHGVQQLVDAHHRQLADAGVYLTFNSIWPATGARPLAVNPSRTMTLQQLSEQVKDTLCNIRPTGEFRLQAATWGREMVGNAALGSGTPNLPPTCWPARNRCWRAGRRGSFRETSRPSTGFSSELPRTGPRRRCGAGGAGLPPGRAAHSGGGTRREHRSGAGGGG